MASGGQIKGITIKIEGDTSNLAKNLTSVNKSINQTSKALKDVEKALKLDPGNVELLEQKQALLTKEIEQTEEKLKLERQAAEDAKEALELGKISQEEYATLQAEVVKTETTLEDLKSAAEGSSEEVEKSGDAAEKSSKGWDVFSSVAQGAAQAITTYVLDALRDAVNALGDFAKDSIQVGMDFDASISQIAATMGTTVDQISDLRDFAQEMGSTTAFSATQAAEALNYMALAGYDAETAMQMLPNVLNLAAAGGIDLATASDMVTDVSSALGLSLEETTEMIDQMARASSISNTSVSQLGEAFLTLGATGANAADGTVELATMLGVLADNGIKGSEGGTHLRNVILSLTNPTDSAAEALRDLGVSVYDSNGDMLDLVDIMASLQEALGDMTQAERDNVIGNIFNRADMAAVNALLNTSAERFEELGDSITNASGAAEAMAETQLDNLAGDVTLFNSALEGAQIAISDALTPSLRQFVQFGTSGISSLTTAFGEGGLEGVIEELNNLIPEAVSMIQEYVGPALDVITSVIQAIGSVITENMDVILGAGIQILMSIAEGIISALPELAPVITDLVVDLASFLVENLPMIIDAAIQIVLAVVTGITGSLDKLIPAAVSAVLTITNSLIEHLPELIAAANELVLAIVQGIIQSLPELASQVPQINATIITALAELATQLPSMAREWGSDLISNFASSIVNAIPNLVSAASQAAQSVADYLHFSEPDKGPLSDFNESGGDMIDNFIKGMMGEEVQLNRALNQTANVIYQGMTGGTDYSGALSGISSQIAGLGGGAKAPQVINVYVGQNKLATAVVGAQAQENYRAGGL